MLKHVVLLKVKGSVQGASREENVDRLKAALTALPERIPEIRVFEVGVHAFARSDNACDLALYSGFDDEAGLEAYRVHPEHQKVVALIGEVASERRVVDYWD